MERLRNAILAVAREDVELIGEMTTTTEELVGAWNVLTLELDVQSITFEELGI